jgi:endoglucanase
MSRALTTTLLIAAFSITIPVSPVAAQQSDSVLALLEALTNAPGPSGFEGPVRDLVTVRLRELGAEISHDGLGSVIGKLDGPPDSPRIMVTAHMDEVGLMVQFIRPDGFIKFKTLGGWLNQALVDQRWVIKTSAGLVHGVSGIRTVHVTPGNERGQVWGPDSLFIDVGATSRADAERMGIRPGDPIAPWSPFTVLANDRYAAKAWDDRVGLAVMLEAMRRIQENGVELQSSVYLVATVQEEIGLRGAQTSVPLVNPDLGISIEAGVAADYPGARQEQAQERLGMGPGIFLLDSSMIPNTKLRDLFFEIAREEGIPLQAEVLTGYGEDGAEIQKFGSGRPSVNMTVPTRYLHSHTGIIDRRDFEGAVELLVAVLRRLNRETVEELTTFREGDR